MTAMQAAARRLRTLFTISKYRVTEPGFVATGAIVAGALIDKDGNIVIAGDNGLGYMTGAGGAVTQATSKATGVTLNKLSGQITLNNASLASSTSAGFTFTNSKIAATDAVIVSIASGATANSYVVGVDAVAAGSCHVHVRNISGGSLGEAVVLNFSVIKGVAA